MKARRARRRTALAATAVALLVAGCSLGQGQQTSTTVRALWYGKDASGALASGVTPMTITETVTKNPEPFAVDLSGLTSGGAGPVWTSAAATASVVATLASTKDPRHLHPSFSIGESIDGPSAGALTTAGVFAAITGDQVRGDVSMTGTILPDGGVGEVGGIPEKLRGAAANGISKVLVPASQTKTIDPSTGGTVDVIALGSDLDVTVVPTTNVWDAYAHLTGSAAGSGLASADAPPVSPETTAVFAAASAGAIDRTGGSISRLRTGAVDSSGTTAAQLKKQVSSELRHAREQLAAGEAFAAYSTATASEQQVDMWLADTGTDAAVKKDGLDAAKAALISAVQQQQRRATDQLARTAAVPASTLEQLAVVPYVLQRDIAVIGTDVEALEALQSTSPAPDAAELRRVAVTLVPAAYHVDHFVPTLSEALTATPGMPIPNRAAALDFLSSYGDFFAYAGDANMEYLDSLTKDSSAADMSSKFNYALAKQDRAEFVKIASDAGNEPVTKTRLSWALHYFMTSTALVAEVGGIDASSSAASAQLNSIQIVDQEQFSGQVQGADGVAAGQERLLAGANLNSSYVRFINAWGFNLATDRTIKVSDARRRLGLEFQWNAIVLGYLLLATHTNTL